MLFNTSFGLCDKINKSQAKALLGTKIEKAATKLMQNQDHRHVLNKIAADNLNDKQMTNRLQLVGRKQVATNDFMMF